MLVRTGKWIPASVLITGGLVRGPGSEVPDRDEEWSSVCLSSCGLEPPGEEDCCCWSPLAGDCLAPEELPLLICNSQ